MFLGPDKECVEDCKAGWEANGEHCYFWSISKAIWDAAERTCEHQGGHLASVTSNATNQYILSGLAQRGMTEELWIGGTDSKEEGSWEWTDGGAWDFTYWAPREPKHTTALNCLQYYSSSSLNPFNFNPVSEFEWYNANCDAQVRFLCSQKLCSGGLKYGNFIYNQSFLWKVPKVNRCTHPLPQC